MMNFVESNKLIYDNYDYLLNKIKTSENINELFNDELIKKIFVRYGYHNLSDKTYKDKLKIILFIRKSINAIDENISIKNLSIQINVNSKTLRCILFGQPMNGKVYYQIIDKLNNYITNNKPFK